MTPLPVRPLKSTRTWRPEKLRPTPSWTVPWRSMRSPTPAARSVSTVPHSSTPARTRARTCPRVCRSRTTESTPASSSSRDSSSPAGPPPMMTTGTRAGTAAVIGAPFGMHAMTDRPCGPSSSLCSWFARCARSQDLPEAVEDVHGRQAPGDAGFGLAALAHGVGELAVLVLDAVGGQADTRHVDGLAVPVGQVVVARHIGARVADVAEGRAERAVVVERQRQRAQRTRGRPQPDGHVHGDAELGVGRALVGPGPLRHL